MGWLRWGAILLFVGILVSAGLFTLLTPGTISDSADQQDVIQRVNEAAPEIDNLTFRSVSTVGDRILVQAEYRGEEGARPREPAEWHRLAESSAQRLYADIVRSRGVEVQIYQDDIMRAVAVAGL